MLGGGQGVSFRPLLASACVSTSRERASRRDEERERTVVASRDDRSSTSTNASHRKRSLRSRKLCVVVCERLPEIRSACSLPVLTPRLDSIASLTVTGSPRPRRVDKSAACAPLADDTSVQHTRRTASVNFASRRSPLAPAASSAGHRDPQHQSDASFAPPDTASSPLSSYACRGQHTRPV